MKKDKYYLFRERPTLFAPCYWNSIYQTSAKTKRLHGTVLDAQYQHYNSGKMLQFCKLADWDKKEKYIFKKLIARGYFDKIDKIVQRQKKKIDLFIENFDKEELSRVGFKDLFKLLKKIKALCLDYDSANVMAWLLGSDKLQEYLFKKLNLSEEDFNLIITPEEKTAVSQLENKLVIYSKEIKEGRRDINEAAKELSEDYGWIPFGYDGPVYWDKDYFIKKLNESFPTQAYKEKPAERKEILSKLNVNDLELIKRANILALWTDERKKYTFRLYRRYSQILWELEKRYSIPYINLKYLFTEELAGLEKNKEKLKKISNDRINNDFMIEAKKGIVKVVSTIKKERVLKELTKQFKGTDIKGIVACKGFKSVYKGIAKVVLSPKEGDKVKEGDFIIATMTSPDYILAMKKAAGFITDEGGMTCHAAIIAREMSKPCIIGTKIATKILRDGNIIEVNTEKGIVKKI
ncbi:MAG: hypothetical protein A2365_02430 [Candidatus Nealsonbacteria bacterium RIFOXYB1_FULL_40_15]|uniref:PEP-utilising enzyme mobile domain-containing protein n=2 Tax=Candidatus Nealsoniibacteriota TaxID=1817911 RepID=A0A1G2EPC4_9BACT|nr:MAG: hypothetical protein A2365_02430 [Candidatus Nealsonbacteria bacterium RIFOXYB1_FULL_40_15]OGZ27645.1 MAG: hypothetical protein A2427_02755 [Candidatus Nealsonbacteria bacterium RIFOXYC1_FULL_40_7]OGZ28689.1 MAG: hypothetical protein A2562_00560 [Candidatus Nealsonbacteria bacterium RIFOXYD1_FULL_39_11]